MTERQEAREIVQMMVDAIESGTVPMRIGAVREAKNWLRYDPPSEGDRPTMAEVKDAYSDWERAALEAIGLYRRMRMLSGRMTAGAAIAVSNTEVEVWRAHETIALALLKEF